MKTVTSLQICISLFVVMSLMACCAKGNQRQLLGGLSEDVKPADEGVQQLVDSFKDEIEQKTRQKYNTLQAISYRIQVVAGWNYFVKVKGTTTEGKEEFLHLRIYKHFRDQPDLTSVKENETLKSPIVHFE